MRKLLIALWAALLFFGIGPSVRAECEEYYVIIFGGQPPVIKNPRRSHTWATFVHVCADGVAEEITMSWLPESGRVRPLALMAEPGRNYSLPETIAFCREHGMEMRAWGPYRIEPELWELASAQKATFDSGAVLYKADDMGARDLRKSNCIHAVSSMVREPGQRTPYVKTAPANWGESGSFWTALTLEPWFIDPCCIHPEIMCKIGLCPEDFIPGYLDRNPTRNPVTRASQAVLHLYLLPNRVHCEDYPSHGNRRH